MVAVAENQAFEGAFHPGQGLEQHVHTLAARMIWPANTMPLRSPKELVWGRSDPGRHRGVGLDALGRKAVAEQFVPHVAGSDDQPVEATVEPDLPPLGAVVDPTDGPARSMIARHRGAAGKKAERGGGPGADPAAQGIVFVSPHTVHVVVVNHPDHRDGTIGKGGNDVQIHHLVQEHRVGTEIPGGLGHLGAGVARRELDRRSEGLAPDVFGPAGAAAVEEGDGVSPALQFGRGGRGVGLSPAEGPQVLMNIKQSHLVGYKRVTKREGRRVLAAWKCIFCQH